MKKFMKGCLIAAGSLTLIGIILIIICACLGGTPLFEAALLNNEFSFYSEFPENVDRMKNDFRDHVSIDVDPLGDEFDEDMDELDDALDDITDSYTDDNHLKWDNNKDYQSIMSSEKAAVGTKEEIQNLDVKMGATELEIKASDDDRYWLQSSENSLIRCYVENGTLVVEGEDDYKYNHDKMYLYIPEAAGIDLADIKMGAGAIEVQKLKCNDLILSVGAGEVTLSDVEAKNADFRVGAGKIDFEGNIQGNIKSECAMGKVQLELAGSETDWNYNIECAAGKVQVGEKKFGSMITYKDIDNNADRTCKIACGMGKTKVRFEE